MKKIRFTAWPARLILFIMMLAVGNVFAADIDKTALRGAIDDLSKSFLGQYTRADEFLKRLYTVTNQVEFAVLQKEALIANPLVSGQPIMFVVRNQYINDHGPDETMYQSNEHNAHCFRGGSALKMLDVAAGSVQTIMVVTNGNLRDVEVSFDAKRLLFSMRKDGKDDYHIYEMDADGKNLKQLTLAPKVSDIQPIYLPSGGIMFTSTREPKYINCQRHLMASLFVMEGDGANIRQIGFNTLFEGRPSLMSDGSVLYSRWEYVDKHFSSAYGLWTMNPDGTTQILHYGGLGWQPGAILDGRQIPGSSRIACIFGSVHDMEWGALVIADPAQGGDIPKSVVKSWPGDISGRLSKWNNLGRVSPGYDSFMGLSLKYQNPCPLSDKYFLVSRMLAPGNGQMALFLVDIFGNEVMLHSEAPGCFQPVLLAARKCPPVIPEKIKISDDSGLFIINDVYRGAGMEKVQKGTVKTIRVVEAPPKLTYPRPGSGDWGPYGDTESHSPTAVNWNNYNTKRILGTVPVESDGSAYFRAPAGRFLYFQLLDESGMMIHSMRSGTTLQPGEKASCVGCHYYRSSPPQGSYPLALQRPASTITPWQGQTNVFNYAAIVQPVLDKHCVACHDYGKDAGKKMNLSGDKGVVFNASYATLMSRTPALWKILKESEPKPLISVVGTGPLPALPPLVWGSHRSRLVDLLRGGHQKVKLTLEELDRIITWIDLNVPYYPDYSDYYTGNTFGRSALNHQELRRLGQLALSIPGGAAMGWPSVTDYVGGRLAAITETGVLPVNFTRPEFSACLTAFTNTADTGYVEALSLIKAGQARLAQHPGADAPGFVPCPADQARLNFHELRKQEQDLVKKAIKDGKKLYDKP